MASYSSDSKVYVAPFKCLELIIICNAEYPADFANNILAIFSSEMATTEQFSLRWNNFHSNLTSGFHDLLEAAEMVDVTLAVDGHFFQAHKIVLSICSPYFKQMFKVNPCKHPIVILKDVGHENMKDILEFMYMGEVSVLRENLTQFLRTAELLQVKGLTGDDSSEETSSTKDNKADCDNDEENEMYNQLIETDVELPIYPSSASLPQAAPAAKRPSKNLNSSTNMKRAKSEAHQSSHNSQKPVKQEQLEPVKSKNEYSNSDFMNMDSQAGIIQNLTTKIETDESKEALNLKSMWENSSTITSADLNSSDQAQCETCGKSMRRSSIRRHMFDVHLPAQQLPCDLCHKLFKTANSLSTHLITIHKKFKSFRFNGFQGSGTGKAEKLLGGKHLYQCGQCLKRFSRRDHLRTHEKNIHGEFAGPFKCVICEQLYKNTESLRKHIAKFHFSTINETIQRIEVKA
ncbi:hypothetical protein NQ315_004312 [Exocentrus adspersus]|uniref:Uncharacterized protein n=1 Tax=Exocentrus adspersus TaxID=1586481 RepID=A0AAV8W7D2_9CUCU|nr:hypothetical protein NQ315_004312 [Exocentrus adspersus]